MDSVKCKCKKCKRERNVTRVLGIALPFVTTLFLIWAVYTWGYYYGYMTGLGGVGGVCELESFSEAYEITAECGYGMGFMFAGSMVLLLWLGTWILRLWARLIDAYHEGKLGLEK